MNRIVAMVLLCGCGAPSTDVDAGLTVDAGRPDAGPQPIQYTQFTLRADGWPAGAKVIGAATLDQVLYVATAQGVWSLQPTETRWAPVLVALTGDQKPTSLQRVDQSLVLTAAGASTGGVYVMPFGGAWAPAGGALPPAWRLVKKSNQWLLAATGRVFSAPAFSGPWTPRSAVGTAPFTKPTSRLVAAAAQQKLFASGDTTQGLGGLYESNDLGATWVASTLRGNVEALAAAGPIVVVSTTVDGQQRSDNYGNTFRPSPLDGGVQTFEFEEGAALWAGTANGLLLSSDNGQTYTSQNQGLPAGTSVRAIFFAGSFVVLDTAEGPWIH